MFNQLFNEGDQNKFPFAHESVCYLICLDCTLLLFYNYFRAPLYYFILTYPDSLVFAFVLIGFPIL